MKAIEERCGACPFGETDYTNNTIRCTKAGIPTYKAYSLPELMPEHCPIEGIQSHIKPEKKVAQ